MYLNDTLNICLLALKSRYPEHVICINEETLALPEVTAATWTAEEIHELLQVYAPQLLQSPALLVIDEQCCAIWLPEQWGGLPVFSIYCRCRIPPHTGNIKAWRTQAAPSFVVA